MSNDKAKCSNKFHKSNMGLWGLCGTCGTGIVSETKCEHRMSCELCGRIGEAPEDKKPDEIVEQVAKQFEDAGRHTMAQFVRAGDPTEQVETSQDDDMRLMAQLDGLFPTEEAIQVDWDTHWVKLIPFINSAVEKAFRAGQEDCREGGIVENHASFNSAVAKAVLSELERILSNCNYASTDSGSADYSRLEVNSYILNGRIDELRMSMNPNPLGGEER